MNKYRVDRNRSNQSTPLGMTSIVIMTDSRSQAIGVFNATQPGVSTWGQPDSRYGVTLAVWDSHRQDYIIERHKGF